MLFPVTCPICGLLGPPRCDRCWDGLPAPPVNAARAVFAYEGNGRMLIGALKYRRVRALAGPIGALMAQSITEDVTSVTWAPTSEDHRAHRRFDQAEQLALSVASSLGTPARPWLRRTGGPGQVGQDQPTRLRGPRFEVDGHPSGTVVLVDDVITTGATMAAGAAALLDAGADRVVWSCAAATPPKKSLFRSSFDL